MWQEANMEPAQPRVPHRVFTEAVEGVNVHFHIALFPKQVYAWIAGGDKRFTELHAAFPSKEQVFWQKEKRKGKNVMLAFLSFFS